MKITCVCAIVPRRQPQQQNRQQKATVAIGKHPPTGDRTEYFVILFTTSNKNGQRYKVKDNIQRVFTRCVAEGKATISFKAPEHDLQLKCEVIQLKAFLQVLKLAMEGKSPEEGTFRVPSIAAVTKADPVRTKMVIHSRAEFPVKGLPKTLLDLEISGLGSSRVYPQVFQLRSLTHLNLSENVIERIPKQLGDLSLQVLNLSHNKLGSSSFKWLLGRNLSSSLHTLDLSHNDLRVFPYEIIKLRNLVTVSLSNNQISKVPFSIRALRLLRNLNLADNQLSALPSTLKFTRLFVFNITGNPFTNSQTYEPPQLTVDHPQVRAVTTKVPHLLELAARVAKRRNIPYSSASVPWILVDFLDEAPMCECGNLVFDPPIFQGVNIVDLLSRFDEIRIDFDTLVLRDAVFCSKKCMRSVLRT